MWEISPAPARPLPCLHRLKEGFRQGLACSFMSNHEEVQHQHHLIQVIKSLHSKATSAILFNSSIGDWFRTTVGVRQWCLLSPTLFNIYLERITTDALEYHERNINFGGRKNHQSPPWWWYLWLSKRGKRTSEISWAFRQSLHSPQHGDQCREGQAGDKQYQRHQQRDPSKWTEALDSHKLQVSGLSCIWLGCQDWDTLQDSTEDSSNEKVETSLERQEHFSCGWLGLQH